MTKLITITYNEFASMVAAKRLYEDELETYVLHGGNKKSDDYKIMKSTFHNLRVLVERWRDAEFEEKL